MAGIATDRVKRVPTAVGLAVVGGAYPLVRLLSVASHEVEHGCGGGALGAAIVSTLFMTALLLVAVVVAAVRLRRWPVLLVFPPVVAAMLFGGNSGLAEQPAALRLPVSACEEPVSAVFPILLAALAGGGTYLLGRPRERAS